MKYLKKFNESNDSEIDSICKKYNIKNYHIENGLVNVDGDVYLYDCDLLKLPLKFGIVSGSFDCSFNNLKSLEGSPYKVSGNFYCRGCKLTTLEGCPEYVGGNFVCSKNKLTTLEGCPEYVGGNFDCNNNLAIKNIEPVDIRGEFICFNTLIHRWWSKINDISKLDIFIDMNINTDDPDYMNQQKINYIL